MSAKHTKNNTTGSLHEKFKSEPLKEEDNNNTVTDDQDASDEESVLMSTDVAELQGQIKAAEERSRQAWDKMLRTQAEAENMLRRTERDVANAHKYGLEKFVNELLPIVDSMERSLDVPQNSKAEEAIVEGVSLTLKMFYNAMEKFGIEQINPIEDAFNPELHQAVSVQPESGAKANTVLQVLQKGYSLNGRLVRPALVIVAQ